MADASFQGVSFRELYGRPPWRSLLDTQDPEPGPTEEKPVLAVHRP